MVEAPAAALAEAEDVAEELFGLLPVEEVLLVRRPLVGVARRDGGALDAEGGLRPLTVVRRLLVRPWEGVALVRLAADLRAAMQSLGRVAALDPALFAGL